MLEKAIEPLIFVCSKCGAERPGSEPVTCGHEYRDYRIKKILKEHATKFKEQCA